MTRFALAWWLAGALPFAVLTYRHGRRLGEPTKENVIETALASGVVGITGPTWWIAVGAAWGVFWGLGVLANLGEES